MTRGRCIVCGKKVRVRKDGRYGKHWIGQYVVCDASLRPYPRHGRVYVRILWRDPSFKTSKALDDVVSWDGPGHGVLNVMHTGGNLLDYADRFDRRDPDLICCRGNNVGALTRTSVRHRWWSAELDETLNTSLLAYPFGDAQFPFDEGYVNNGAFAAYVSFRDGALELDRIKTRRRQIEQAAGTIAANHNFALPG